MRFISYFFLIITMTMTADDVCNNDNKDHTQVMFWSTAVCRPVRDIEVLRDLQVDPIVKKPFNCK